MRYQAYAARIHELRRYGFGKRETGTGSLLRSWLRAGPLQSAIGAAGQFVRSPNLLRVLAFYASQSGGSPDTIPAAFSELAHTYLNDGMWYPRGGPTAIPQALATLAGEYDASIRLSCNVKRIEIERNKVIGVTLETDSEFLRADAVVSSLDPLSTARYLLPEHAFAAPVRRRLAQTPMSRSAFIMLLGIRGTSPQLAHHNVFLSNDDRAEADQIFRRAVMPDDPTITLSISCKTESLNAPFNQENWLIAVSAPPLSERVNWATERTVSRDRILTILESRYGLDLRDRIRIEKHLTPADLSQMSGAWRGSLYGELPQGRRAALGATTDSQPACAASLSCWRSSDTGRWHAAGFTVGQGGRCDAASRPALTSASGPRHHQERHAPLLHDGAILLDDSRVQNHGAAAQPPRRLRLSHFQFDMNRIADINRTAEFHLQAPKAEHGTLQNPQLISLPDGVAQRQHAVRHPLPHERVLGVFGVGVHRIVVAGQCSELHQVGFGDGATARPHRRPNFELLKIETARSVLFHFHQQTFPQAARFSAVNTPCRASGRPI